jgi:hypothetical protein
VPAAAGIGVMENTELDQQVLVEINRGILHSYYTFKPGAPLKPYIQLKTKQMRASYTLAEVK